MKIKDVIKLLRRFKDAELRIEDRDIHFDIYEDQTGKMVVNVNVPKDKKTSLDKQKKVLYNNYR